MNTVTELLPPTKSARKGGAARWTAGRRLLEIVLARSRAAYRVHRIGSIEWSGWRTFGLEKLSPGEDRSRDRYACLIAGDTPGDDACQCEGYVANQRCKHLAALRALVEAGAL
jgi:hypothetical protein